MKGRVMTAIQIDQQVELTRDIPELGLHRGDKGIVCSTWFKPATMYEIEFHKNTSIAVIRALLKPEQIMGA